MLSSNESGSLNNDLDINAHSSATIQYSAEYYNGVVTVEGAGKKAEEKFDFTADGEALGYISLTQARSWGRNFELDRLYPPMR